MPPNEPNQRNQWTIIIYPLTQLEPMLEPDGLGQITSCTQMPPNYLPLTQLEPILKPDSPIPNQINLEFGRIWPH